MVPWNDFHSVKSSPSTSATLALDLMAPKIRRSSPSSRMLGPEVHSSLHRSVFLCIQGRRQRSSENCVWGGVASSLELKNKHWAVSVLLENPHQHSSVSITSTGRFAARAWKYSKVCLPPLRRQSFEVHTSSLAHSNCGSCTNPDKISSSLADKIVAG